MFLDTLDPSAWLLFRRLGSEPLVSSSFFLAGGSALALHLGPSCFGGSGLFLFAFLLNAGADHSIAEHRSSHRRKSERRYIRRRTEPRQGQLLHLSLSIAR